MVDNIGDIPDDLVIEAQIVEAADMKNPASRKARKDTIADKDYNTGASLREQQEEVLVERTYVRGPLNVNPSAEIAE